MTPEMQKALNQFFTDLLTGTEKYAQQGAAFMQEQIPLVLREKLYFDFSVAVVWVCFSVIFFVVAWLVSRWAMTKIRPDLPQESSYRFDKTDASILSVGIRISAGLISSIILIVNTTTMLKIYFAPRLYIVDWLRQLAAAK